MQTAKPISNRYQDFQVFNLSRLLPPRVIVENALSLQELIRNAGFEPPQDDPTGRALLRELTQHHEPAVA